MVTRSHSPFYSTVLHLHPKWYERQAKLQEYAISVITLIRCYDRFHKEPTIEQAVSLMLESASAGYKLYMSLASGEIPQALEEMIHRHARYWKESNTPRLDEA